MSRIFISHATVDSCAVYALREWLQSIGLGDQYFLDSDLRNGVIAGELWPESIERALTRCEIVLSVLSPGWARSTWCRIEFERGRDLGKWMLFAVIDPHGYEDLLDDIKRRYQIVDLSAAGRAYRAQVSLPDAERTVEVAFNAQALDRLRIGFEKAGIAPDSFPLPERDRLYPGLRALDTQDAAVFFGRDPDIVRGLATLRRMRRQPRERVLVVFAASGAGKSSLLRAGLWPRLQRAESEFLTLPVMRPGEAALSGEHGLFACLHEAAARERADFGETAEDWRHLVDAEGLDAALDLLRQAALQRITAGGLNPDLGPPMPVLMVDQGEELFSAQSGAEAKRFLEQMAAALTRDALMLVICLRPEACEQWQNLQGMDAVEQHFYLLPKVPVALVKDIIEGPARRDRQVNGYRGLDIDPLLTERLIDEWSGEDALPLLALTLNRLYTLQGQSGRLTLAAYDDCGGLAGMLDAAIRQAIDRAVAEGVMPASAQRQRNIVHRAFVPALLAIHPQTQEPVRRLARFEEFPPDTHGLIRFLLDARLLSESVRHVDGTSLRLVEVAHEALLRRWPALQQAAEHERGVRDKVRALMHAAAAWSSGGRNESGLRHIGTRLQDIRRVLGRHDLATMLDQDTKDYLAECVQREARLRRQQRWNAVRRGYASVAAMFVRRHYMRALALVTVCLLLASAVALNWRLRTEVKALVALSERSTREGSHGSAFRYAIMAANRNARLPGPFGVDAAVERLREVGTLSPTGLSFFSATSRETIVDARYADTSPILLVMSDSRTEARLIDLRTAREHRLVHSGRINSASISDDGALALTAADDGFVKIWSVETGREVRSMDHQTPVRYAKFGASGRRVVSLSHVVGQDYPGFYSDHPAYYRATMWNGATGGRIADLGLALANFDDDGYYLHWDPDGMLFGPEAAGVFLQHSRNKFSLIDARNGRLNAAPGAVVKRAFPVMCSSQASSCVWSGKDGALTVVEYEGLQSMSVTPVFSSFQLSISPRGDRLVFSDPWEGVNIVNAKTGAKIVADTCSDFDRSVDLMKFSSGGRFLVVVCDGDDESAVIVDPNSGRRLFVLQGDGRLNELYFSVGDDLLALEKSDGSMVVWSLVARRPVARFLGPGKVIFSPDVASILVWDDRGAALYTLPVSDSKRKGTRIADAAPPSAGDVCRVLARAESAPANARVRHGFSRDFFDDEMALAPFLDPATERDVCRPPSHAKWLGNWLSSQFVRAWRVVAD